MFLRFFALITLTAIGVYWFHIHISPKDVTHYEQLIQESTELRTKHALAEKPALQKRQNVQKDIWSQNETRHFRIQSEQSELTIAKTDAVEELKNIHCHFKDDFILSADEGIYSFPSHQFTAQKNCHLLQNANQIDGTLIHLDLNQEIVTYENPKGFIASGPLRFTAKKLVWHKKQGKLILTDDVTIEQPGQFTLKSNLGTLTLNEYEPTLLVLEGEVKLLSTVIQDKISNALADTLTYRPKEKSLLFSSAKKVLFWQDGLSLSASEVLIREDKTVEGHGDVHFSFNFEEQNYIDELFKNYL